MTIFQLPIISLKSRIVKIKLVRIERNNSFRYCKQVNKKTINIKKDCILSKV